MNELFLRTLTCVFVGVGGITATHAQTLKLARTISLPGVEGRIDHLSFDAAAERLFVAALGNNTVEVVDLKAGKVTRSLTGFSEPQGVLYVADVNRLYVANGGDGSLRVFDRSLAPLKTIKFDDDADNLRYDSAAKRIYVGYGSGALGIVDVEKDAVVDTIPLSAHPESFQLEKNGAGIFVNLPNSHNIAVIDRKAKKVTGTWSLGFVIANFPMALDEENRRAFIACRTPARLLVYDSDSGHQVAKLDLHGDCDDVFYDEQRKRIYASCGEGFIDVFSQSGADHYVLRETVKTTPKARTCLFAADHLYLAAPRYDDSPAEVRIYDVAP